MNYTSKVAEMLGVELGEEFKIRFESGDITKAVWICVPGDGIVERDFNDSDLEHLALYKLGKLYRTREEAEAHAKEDKAYWDEVRKELEE